MQDRNNWNDCLRKLLNSLRSMSVTDQFGKMIQPEEGFRRWEEATCRLRSDGGCVYLIGNGASASMASHFATDLAKNGGLRTQIFTDLSLLTAIGNDICFERVFAEPLAWYMRSGEMLVAISSSGNSLNIVRAIEVARQRKGVIITLSSFHKNNAIRALGDINFYIPSITYGQAETGHGAILHHFMDLVENVKAY
jgi:D-sedoheptulose 7-phosphate isomerase